MSFLAQYVENGATSQPIAFHVLHVADISRSRLAQLDEWKEYDDPRSVAVDRLNRRVIREVNMDDATVVTDGAPTRTSPQTFKLLLRDVNNANNYCYGYEYNDMLPFLRDTNTATPLATRLGGRILVKQGTPVQNGVLLLTRRQCQYLGMADADKSLVDQLNTGIIRKYIDILDSELKNQG